MTYAQTIENDNTSQLNASDNIFNNIKEWELLTLQSNMNIQ